MKIRKGFVTNSSSSSFIIATKRDDNGDLTPELKNIILKWAISELQLNNPIKTEQQLKRWFIDKNSCKNYTLETILEFPTIQEQYDKALNDLNNGVYIKDGWAELKTKEQIDRYFERNHSHDSEILDKVFKDNQQAYNEYLEYLKNDSYIKNYVFNKKCNDTNDLREAFIEEYFWNPIFFEETMKSERDRQEYQKLLSIVNNKYAISYGCIDCELGDGEANVVADAIEKMSKSKDFIGIDTDMSY